MRNFWSKCKAFAAGVVHEVQVFVIGLAVAAVVALSFNAPMVSQAIASVPAGVETVFTGAATDFATVVDYGWVAFLAIVGGLILFGLVRRVIGRAIGR